MSGAKLRLGNSRRPPCLNQFLPLRCILGAERVVTGQFQAMMTVEIINDGPVTIEIKSRSEP